MNATISLSISRLQEVIYAHSAALRLWTGDDTALITDKHSELLSIFINEEVDRIAMDLSFVVDDVDRSDEDIIALKCRLGNGTSVRIWRRSIETAVCAGVMARIMADRHLEGNEVYIHDRTGLIESMRRQAAMFTLPGNIARGA